MYKEYSDDQLYTQLSYLDYLLDCQKMKQVLTDWLLDHSPYIFIISQDEVLQRKLVAYRNCDAETKYADIQKIVNQKYMKHNGFSSVSLAKLFEGLGPMNKTPAQG